MVKLRGPLFSFDAHGSFGPRLTYSRRKSGSQVRFQRAQADKITTDRETERGYFQDGATAWQTLTDVQKAAWNTFNSA